ncbi:hypothetical protein CDAR_48871 [Caerostris darwini]|uniref:Uncharacterized protein n=1 Tax=Caerostris darwini TaxID=1538125 RepID=A0AAV4NKD5_9ARAC|nr:hypothetical protein CDAR_48871 [Caerostris darwini]
MLRFLRIRSFDTILILKIMTTKSNVDAQLTVYEFHRDGMIYTYSIFPTPTQSGIKLQILWNQEIGGCSSSIPTPQHLTYHRSFSTPAPRPCRRFSHYFKPKIPPAEKGNGGER